MLAYLQAHPKSIAARAKSCAPCRRVVRCRRAASFGGIRVDPCTVQTVKVDERRNGAFEREQNAVQRLATSITHYDVNPDFTSRIRCSTTSIRSRIPGCRTAKPVHQGRREQVTVTKRSRQLAAGFMRINSLASANYRAPRVDSQLRRRLRLPPGRDVQRRHQLPNTKFWTQYSDDTYATGTPASTIAVDIRRTRRRPHVRLSTCSAS
jgi:hypothetical protein